jgi:hypothetical protein
MSMCLVAWAVVAAIVLHSASCSPISGHENEESTQGHSKEYTAELEGMLILFGYLVTKTTLKFIKISD